MSEVSTFCTSLISQFSVISTARKERLQQLADFILTKIKAREKAKLIVICTHNSRRSHIGQICLAVAADYFGIKGIDTFSGGTEATAFNPRAVRALRDIGFQIETADTATDNPRYLIRWKEDTLPYFAFSKRYDEPPNPTRDFAAIMVCSEADQGCPVVLGSALRLSLPFDDPKAFDDTPEEQKAYREAIERIGRELFYAVHLVKKAGQAK
ncbi:MAG: protein-tyrosine-phosphatase [Bacteroidota bacterium]